MGKKDAWKTPSGRTFVIVHIIASTELKIVLAQMKAKLWFAEPLCTQQVLT